MRPGDLGTGYTSSGQSASPLTQLQTRQKTDVARCAADALLRDAFRLAGGRKLGPLARQLLPRSLFIVYAALCGLINREPGGCGKGLSPAPGDIEPWQPAGGCRGYL